MINSIQIENFRCFKRLIVDDLQKFNIVVGDNSSGKTAFLESIFLAGGHAEIVNRLKIWRGLGQFVFSGDKKGYESLWSDLFYDFSDQSQITIALKGTAENQRTLKIYYNPATETPLFAEEKADVSTIVPITFQVLDSKGKTHVMRPNINTNGQLTLSGSAAPHAVALCASSTMPNPQEMAANFSQLSIENKLDNLNKSISNLFPEISDLSILVTGGFPQIFCSYRGLSSKIPISLVSNGLNKLIMILLTIAKQESGIILIDEIENGFHYSKHTQVWSAIITFCERYNVQLIASSHSIECLRALRSLMENKEHSFRLLRTEVKQNGERDLRMFKGHEFESALEMGTEFR
ncbi:MAG TPA: AAA family ATPase [Chthoniobacteraceae bacterium]|nr:AAA family ATPase [Chthoniobacteraceae bacterium]